MNKYYAGFDLGNGTCKIVIIDDNNNLIDSVYLINHGIIKTLSEAFKKIKHYKINSCGITGAGKVLSNILIGSDIIKTEIVAHTIGVLNSVKDVRTIIDLGKEDSKIIIVNNGIIEDCDMNASCLKEDMNITIKDYKIKKIKDIKVGDKVLTHKGRFKKVTKIFKRNYNSEIINIKTSNLRKLEITPEHTVLALKRKDIKCYKDKSRDIVRICRPDRNIEWCKKHRCAKKYSFKPNFIPANQLEKGDLIAIPLPNEVINYNINYEKIKGKKIKFGNPEKKVNFKLNKDILRFIGYWLAEGNITYNRSRINKKIRYPSGLNLTFNIKEENYIKDIFEIAFKNFPNITIKCKKYPQHNTAIIRLYSKDLAKYILYLCNSKANNKVMSSELMFLKPELQLEILKGLFRGDGYFSNKIVNKRMSRRFTLTTISKQLAYQVQWILLRNKINCSFFKDKIITKGGHIAYNIDVTGLEINKLQDDLFKIDKVKKRQGYSFFFRNWLFVPIKKIIKENFNGNVYNLEVEGDNSYITNSLSVHNCSSGCGAYLENVAHRFNIKIEDFGNLALQSKNKVHIDSMCSVFGTSSAQNLLNTGVDKKDILMGVARSLVRNYCNMFISSKIEEPVVFTGGVSMNRAVVKAFEEKLNCKIIVPENSHLMGAIGAAILSKETKETKFKGWNLNEKDYEIKTIICDGCENECNIPVVYKNDKKIGISYNGRCGKW